jgi:hypothetical protein
MNEAGYDSDRRDTAPARTTSEATTPEAEVRPPCHA